MLLHQDRHMSFTVFLLLEVRGSLDTNFKSKMILISVEKSRINWMLPLRLTHTAPPGSAASC